MEHAEAAGEPSARAIAEVQVDLAREIWHLRLCLPSSSCEGSGGAHPRGWHREPRVPKLHFPKCFSEAQALAGVGAELAQARLLACALFPPVPHSQLLSCSDEDEVEAAAQAFWTVSGFPFC